jgi:putative membrane-bound dehydrogenase-like protein
MKHRTLSLLLVFLAPLSGLAQDMEPGPKSPEESLQCMKARPGFKVELMAAEPLVQDPIAFAWGPDGKFWVVEMGDYPLGTDGQGKPGGRVKFLTKSRADGPYDKATVFLDNLGFPTGVTPWDKGVLVTCAPDIFYAADTDGDGKADQYIQGVATGFAKGNQQHRVNGLVFGLDNWLYGANGDSGGLIKAYNSKVTVDIRGRDFRIHPNWDRIEAQSGQTQFGRSRDDWGNWFGNNNSNPMWHYVLDDYYLKRNPHVLYPDPRVHISVQPGAAPVYPISKPQARFNSPHALNHFTSACSAIIYRDNLFGPEFAGNSFVSEPVHNLIHREVVKKKGVTFTSQRADDEQKSEFRASSDNWFRPTMIQTGPDGALWVADMYRQVIEHPEWIPKDWQKKLDLRAGHDKGRIYRIYPKDKKLRVIPQLDKLTTKELVVALESSNGWTRDLAQQLLVRKNDPLAIAPLREMMRNNRNSLARLHALCVLDGVNHLEREDLIVGLLDVDSSVRRQALRACENPAKNAMLLASTLIDVHLDDRDPQFLIQLGYSLGAYIANDISGKALGKFLYQHGEDKFLLAAGLSSVHKGNWPYLLTVVLKSPSCPPPLLTNLLQLAPVLGEPGDLARLLAFQVSGQKGKNQFEQFVHMANLLDTLDKSKNSLGRLWQKNNDPAFRQQLEPLKEVFQAARATVRDPKAPLGDKMVALKLLGKGFDQFNEDYKLLASLLVPQMPEDLQAAAMQTLGQAKDFRIPRQLLNPWKSYSPGLRAQALDILLSKPDWTHFALEALQRKDILANEVDIVRRQRFLEHKDEEVRTLAAKIFARTSQPDRNKVVEQYLLPLITSKGDVATGSKLFTKHCATCHQLGKIGQQVGPDLTSVADKTPEGLLTAILDPNRALEARYVNYLATTKAGLTLTGLLLSETSTSITLISADGKKHGLLRTEIDDLVSTGKSAMPEGFEKDIPPQDMADLIAFLRSNLPLPKPKTFAGNHPETVRPEPDGTLRLLPRNASIYGKTLILEKELGNLGYWSSPDDHAVWTVDVPREGNYYVWLSWACAADTAGNHFALHLGKEHLHARVESTEKWDNYRRVRLGQVRLTQGQVEVRMEPWGTLRGALLDLKEIQLVPVSP